MRAGFLTSSSQSQNIANVFSRPNAEESRNITSIASISRAASGSVEAVGGEDAVHGAGGRGGIRRTSSQFDGQSEGDVQVLDVAEDLQLSLPGMVSVLPLHVRFSRLRPQGFQILLSAQALLEHYFSNPHLPEHSPTVPKSNH